MTIASHHDGAPQSADSSLTTSLRAAVRALYERRPYPHYPLLAKPRWQEGWISSSLLSKALASSATGFVSQGKPRRILIAGCGEILPAVICANEPATHRVDAIDLSRRSLRRALFRCVSELARLQLRHADLEVWCGNHREHYDHIDCFGVLHHMADPLRALSTLSQALKPGGTARVMVYNSPARSWIHEWQSVFKLMRLDQSRAQDIQVAMRLLREAGKASSTLADLLGRMGPSLLTNTTRFADTFLHPREARLGPAAWIKAIAKSDLKIIGLHDRYEECDDLCNPLWGIDQKELIERVETGLFEGNLEFFLQRRGGVTKPEPLKKQRLPRWAFHLLSTPPRAWWQTSETANLPASLRRYLWRAHREHIGGSNGFIPDHTLASISLPALQRLARMGAILPGQVPGEWIARIAKPLCIPEGIKAPKKHKTTDIPEAVSALLEKHCANLSFDQRRKSALLLRLQRAVYPA